MSAYYVEGGGGGGGIELCIPKGKMMWIRGNKTSVESCGFFLGKWAKESNLDQFGATWTSCLSACNNVIKSSFIGGLQYY